MGKKRPNPTRRTGGRGKPKERFLIVCEGEETERNYFKSFPLNKELLEVEVFGAGRNSLSLVEKAMELKKIAKSKGEEFDQVWCVFDWDSISREQINSAFELAKRNKIKIAFSHEAFELWYLLHFNYMTSGLSRDDYKGMLTERLGFRYEKNSKSMYEKLLDKQEAAIRNAERLLEIHKGKDPCDSAPSTTVHKLVMELNKSLRRRGRGSS